MQPSRKSSDSDWYDIEVVRPLTYRISIRWWRPGFWREAYRTLRQAGASRSESAWFTAVLVWVLLKAN